jgi:hypothetical protein
MDDKIFYEYQKMIQAHLAHSLQELAEVIDREIEESPEKYFGVGVYGDLKDE